MGNEFLAWPEKTDREVIIRALRKAARYEQQTANVLEQQLSDFPDKEYEVIREHIDRCKKKAGRFMIIAHDLEDAEDE